jgi:type IV secretory pathway ATPase VirB11/archaellum biosynthesis ATPase
MDNTPCLYEAKRRTDQKILTIHCRDCDKGHSTLCDQVCRRNIIQILQNEHGVDRLILDHVLVKVFAGEELQCLQDLLSFVQRLETHRHTRMPRKGFPPCATCEENRQRELWSLIDEAPADPIVVFFKLYDLRENLKPPSSRCAECHEKYKAFLSELIENGELQHLKEKRITSDMFYMRHIRPYIRPGFIDSFLQLEPPPDAIFLESYEIRRKQGRPFHVALYILRTRPEKLYFVVPPEYELPHDELIILEKVRTSLLHHRPKDVSFMDAATAEDYFHRLSTQIISHLAGDQGMSIEIEHIEHLADIFARYSAGFGILEDLFLDRRIQDIYVNAPVSTNPIHLVLDGEEYTSNIYLSERDSDALASRFRTFSGRAFSEASPVLDLDLKHFRTRVAAISKPLTPQGIAFAFRRHRSKPWTLAHFIANHMISPLAAGFLSFLVDGQASLLVAGSRGAGKTSLLGALILEIPQRFRILTIEDTAEIPVDDFQRDGYKIQSLITKSIATGSASSEVDPTDALRTALRLGESVLILGEVRGVEAKVLFEAMRIGAAGNLIMGTIHGSTTRDVYERVVYDIGVPPTSFKAVDAVVIAAPIRCEGGIERKRKVVQISEITKTGWQATPDPDKIFQDIMMYDASKDELIATDLLHMGQSQVIQSIAKKWGITVEKALENIQLRTDIKKLLVDQSTTKKDLLESSFVRDTNNAFWMSIEDSRHRNKTVNYEDVRRQWMAWFEAYLRRIP